MVKVELIETEEAVTYVDVEYNKEELSLTLRFGIAGRRRKVSIYLDHVTHACGIGYPGGSSGYVIERQVVSETIPILGEPLRLLLESSRDRVTLWLGPSTTKPYISAKKVEF